jgi:hypothetical protein
VDDEKRAFAENNNRAYKLLTLHCSPATVTAMKSMKDYTRCRDDQDGIGLLALIQSVTFNKNASKGNRGMLDLVRVDKKAYCIILDVPEGEQDTKRVYPIIPSHHKIGRSRRR